jgi:hypothetical protein
VAAQHSRRSFLRNALPQAVRDAARTRQELMDAAGRPLEDVQDRPAEDAAPGRPWAGPATHCCDAAELETLIAAEGLGRRAADVRALARVSHRLLPAGRPAPPPSDDLLIVLDPASLPATDWLVPVPAGVVGIDASVPAGEVACAVTVERGGAPLDGCSIGGRTVTASAELVLPRAWAASVEALELEPEEQTAWERLRLSLAERQGIEPLDATRCTHRLHRLLGHPDDRSGLLPLICASFDRGAGVDIDVTGAERAELEHAASRWALVLQVATMDAGAEQTVTVWCDRAELARRDWRTLVAVRQPV